MVHILYGYAIVASLPVSTPSFFACNLRMETANEDMLVGCLIATESFVNVPPSSLSLPPSLKAVGQKVAKLEGEKERLSQEVSSLRARLASQKEELRGTREELSREQKSKKEVGLAPCLLLVIRLVP